MEEEETNDEKEDYNTNGLVTFYEGGNIDFEIGYVAPVNRNLASSFEAAGFEKEQANEPVIPANEMTLNSFDDKKLKIFVEEVTQNSNDESVLKQESEVASQNQAITMAKGPAAKEKVLGPVSTPQQSQLELKLYIGSRLSSKRNISLVILKRK